jgi:uncharacterized membrane protein (DUF485 family)
VDRPVDWEGVERTPEFQELVRRRRSFVVPCTIFFLVWYLAFIALAGYAPDFMGERVYEGVTVGYLLALTQFVMVWGLGAAYLRRSRKVFDPLREAAVRASGHHEDQQASATDAVRARPVAPAQQRTEVQP